MIRATINFKTIHGNIKKLRKQLLPHVKICAVLKANAYTLGDVVVATEIQSKVDCFAVANIKEAIRLRANDIKKPILLLGVCEDFQIAIQHNVILSIHNLAEIKALSKLLINDKKCKIHIKVNTGMNRYGITNVWQLKHILNIAEVNRNIQVDGLYTHLAFETDNTSEIDTQLKKFAPFKSVMLSHHPKAIIHAACSGSASYLPAQFDMVRVGKLLYGGFYGYRTAIKITSKITAIQHLNQGAKIGYNGTDIATRPMISAVVPCGYADLAHINYSNTHYVLVDKQPCKILGRICMDTFMIDVTNIHAPLGKNVTIMSDEKGLTIMDISNQTKTIACNLLCSFNFNRSEIIYKK